MYFPLKSRHIRFLPKSIIAKMEAFEKVIEKEVSPAL